MSRRLSILAILSLIPATVLLCGYVARFGVLIQHTRLSGPSPSSRQVDVLLDGGRVEIWDSPAGAPPRTQIHRWQIFWGFRLRLPDVRRSAWEFDAHALGNAKLGRLYLIAFPIWCALLPCLIAPALWWRDHRRRGRAEQRGFPLDAVALAATSPA